MIGRTHFVFLGGPQDGRVFEFANWLAEHYPHRVRVVVNVTSKQRMHWYGPAQEADVTWRRDGDIITSVCRLQYRGAQGWMLKDSS